MLDASPSHLTAIGTVEIADGKVYVAGFGAHQGTCRDVAALALVWAIGQLQAELLATMQKPGGGNVCVG